MKCLLFFCDLQIVDVFYYVQKVVFYLIVFLFDQEIWMLKFCCVWVLKRIFMFCDWDKDGVFNDVEFNDFQVFIMFFFVF